jgi:hypothetical protein
VQDGQPASVIVLADTAVGVEKQAAQELTASRARITGAQIGTVPAPVAGNDRISVGTLGMEHLPLTGEMRASLNRISEEGSPALHVMSAQGLDLDDGMVVRGGK